MIINKILKVIILLLGGIFIVLQSLAYEVEGAAIRSLMFLLLTVLYYRWTEIISNLFLWFLVIFTVAEIFSFTSYYLPIIPEGKIDYYYFGVNILYIIAYLSLIVKVLTMLDFKKVFLEHSIPILILVVLDIFCVNIVSETTEYVFTTSEYYLEFAYNTVIMTLLSVALISYMYRNDNKSMLFLLACIFTVFSEIIQLAYYYILEVNNLGFTYAFFMMGAFLLFYMQSQLQFTGPIPEYTDELEA